MLLLVSSENPACHCLVARLPEGCRIEASFHDEEGVRDLTGFLCDLVLVGMHLRFERSSGQSAPPDEEVEVASLALVGGDPTEALFLYAHPGSGVVSEFSWEDALPLLALGVAFQITSGVAHEAADVPGSPEGLEDDHPTGA